MRADDVSDLIDRRIADRLIGTASNVRGSWRRGMLRDSRLGRDHSHLWNDVWVPTNRDFDLRFVRERHAEILFGWEST